jgi:hypothetical protein
MDTAYLTDPRKGGPETPAIAPGFLYVRPSAQGEIVRYGAAKMVIPTILSPMNSKTRMAIGLVLGAASASNNVLLRNQVPAQDLFLVKQ